MTTDRELVIPTLAGVRYAAPGDWIIRGALGEIYPCKPHIFERPTTPSDNKEIAHGRTCGRRSGRKFQAITGSTGKIASGSLNDALLTFGVTG